MSVHVVIQWPREEGDSEMVYEVAADVWWDDRHGRARVDVRSVQVGGEDEDARWLDDGDERERVRLAVLDEVERCARGAGR